MDAVAAPHRHLPQRHAQHRHARRHVFRLWTGVTKREAVLLTTVLILTVSVCLFSHVSISGNSNLPVIGHAALAQARSRSRGIAMPHFRRLGQSRAKVETKRDSLRQRDSLRHAETLTELGSVSTGA
jgi:hypothetical protein